MAAEVLGDTQRTPAPTDEGPDGARAALLGPPANAAANSQLDAKSLIVRRWPKRIAADAELRQACPKDRLEAQRKFRRIWVREAIDKREQEEIQTGALSTRRLRAT